MKKWMHSWKVAIRYLLDTQVLVQAYHGTLPFKIQEMLSDPDDERILSTISLVEIAIKAAIGKLELSADDVQRSVDDLRISLMSFEPHHAMGMFSLPQHHRDPFDRMILATALVEKLPIVTADRTFHRYSGIRIIW